MKAPEDGQCRGRCRSPTPVEGTLWTVVYSIVYSNKFMQCITCGQPGRTEGVPTRKQTASIISTSLNSFPGT